MMNNSDEGMLKKNTNQICSIIFIQIIVMRELYIYEYIS